MTALGRASIIVMWARSAVGVASRVTTRSVMFNVEPRRTHGPEDPAADRPLSARLAPGNFWPGPGHPDQTEARCIAHQACLPCASRVPATATDDVDALRRSGDSRSCRHGVPGRIPTYIA